MIHKTIDDSLQLDDYQLGILNGLKEIGEEIAYLYLDGIKIFNSRLRSKSYLLAHIAREIEGGIRDIFASGKRTDVQKCTQGSIIKKQSSHIDEICEVLGVNKTHELAKKWHRVAKDFHKYAHRHGPWKTPREEEAFDNLWKEFERILYKLVGDYLNLISLVDRLLAYEKPTDAILKTLENLLQNKARRNYFFKKLRFAQWFKPLLERGYFEPDKTLTPQLTDQADSYIIPQWDVLPYLERVSEQVNKPGNEKYIGKLLEIIKDVTNYHIENNKILDNYKTWQYFIKILSKLPNDKIPEDIIDLIPIWLDSKFDTSLQTSEITTKLLPKFLTDNKDDIEKALRIIDHLTGIKEEHGKKVLKAAFFWLKEFFTKHYQVLAEKCTIEIVKILANRLKELISSEHDGTLYSFYDYEDQDYRLERPVEFLSYVLTKIMSEKAQTNPDELKPILREFLQEQKLIFPKLALFVIAHNIESLKDVFWEKVESEDGSIIFENTLSWGDELKRVLERLGPLTEEQRKLLKEKIEQGVAKLVEDLDNVDESEKDTLNTIGKQEIYRALSYDDTFKILYEKLKEITGTDAALHPAIGKTETRWGVGPSPLSKEEILKMPNDSLADYLAKFKTQDPWKGPTVGGLAEMLYQVAKESPEKFVENFTPFKDTGFVYIYKILNGILEAWRNKKPFNWSKLFQFIVDYTNREDFWDDKFIVEKGKWLTGADHKWIIGIVAELIQEGTRDDSWAFSEDHFEEAEKIIFLMLDKLLESEKNEETTDYVTYTLNTPLGKTLTALILLALRIARVNAKKGIKDDIKWSDNYREKFDDILSKKFIEGYTNLGRYMPNLYYLDKDWVKEKINALKNEFGTIYWEAFMSGYLSTGRVYEVLYQLMKFHYSKGIEYKFKQKHDNDFIIQHIALGYLQGYENIEDEKGLFRKILNIWEPEQIRSIINFFWTQRSYLNDESSENKTIKERIISFWKWVYENKYKDKTTERLNNEDRMILSELTKLTVFLPKIDSEKKNWLLLCAPYADENFNSPFLIEYLDRFEDEESIKNIGEIFLKMLERFIPDYDQKHIRSIVEKLYKNGLKEDANQICNKYGIEGYEFLRDFVGKV